MVGILIRRLQFRILDGAHSGVWGCRRSAAQAVSELSTIAGERRRSVPVCIHLSGYLWPPAKRVLGALALIRRLRILLLLILYKFLVSECMFVAVF